MNEVKFLNQPKRQLAAAYYFCVLSNIPPTVPRVVVVTEYI